MALFTSPANTFSNKKKLQTKDDPARYTDPRKEGAGAVASDSLAADSTRSGGGFSENRDSQPLGVSGSHSTLANEDTQSATRLGPAPDAEARKARDDWSDQPSGGYQHQQQQQQQYPSTTSRIAPAGSQKPKGKNLTEGGFDDSTSKNASFNSDIGTKQDPARLAENRLQHEMAEVDATAAKGPKDKPEKGDNQPYSALTEETA